MSYSVIMRSEGGSKRLFETCATEQEATNVAEYFNWRWIDENDFEWKLEVVENELHQVTIVETLKRTISVVSFDAGSAVAAVKAAYDIGGEVLHASDFDSVDFVYNGTFIRKI